MVKRLTVQLTDGRVWTALRSSVEVIECDECGTTNRVWIFTSNHPKETAYVFHCAPCLRDGFDREFIREITWEY